jgi:hypothetical protein
MAAIERAGSLAKDAGLTGEDDRLAVLRCMVLVGSDLGRATGPDADIRLTLGMTDRPAEQRVRRITRIARTVADDRGGPAGLGAGAGAPASPPDERPSTDAPAPAVAPTRAPDPEPTTEPAPEPPSAPAPPPARRPAPSPEKTPEPPAEDFGFRDHPPRPAATSADRPSTPETPAPPPRAPGSDRPRRAATAPPGDTASTAGEPADGEAVAVPGYDAISGAAVIAAPAVDAATGERVLISRGRGDADAAIERLGLAATIVHRNLEKITDTVTGSAGGSACAFAVAADEERATLDAMRPRLQGLTTADADAVIGAFLLTEGALAPHLAQVVADRQRVHERLVLSWAADLADALQAAHHAGIAHGAVDDTMVVLDRHGVLLLRGLGLADPADPSIDALADGPLKGAAPERVAAAADGEPIRPEHAPAADLWSLGVLVYTLLSGRPPFEGHRSALLRDIVTREPAPVRDIAEGLSDGASDACMAALVRDPAGRPPSMDAYAEILREAAAGDGRGKRKLGLFGRK